MLNKPLIVEYIKCFSLLILVLTGIIKSLFFDIDYTLLGILMVCAIVAATGKDFSPSNIFNSSTDKEE
ncbi:MAG: hypothetical protein QM585_12665 [Enterobacter sp.]